MEWFYIFIATLAMVHCGSQATNSQCSSDSRSVGLSVSSTKNDSGQWTDLFSARSEHSSALHSITMDVLHNITECDGRRVIHIQGSIQKVGESEKGMVFHSRVGSNVIISNDDRTIEKKKIDDYENGTAFTSRPLKNDELFEVILNRKGRNFQFCFGIGVSTVRPEDFEFPTRAYESPHAWMYHNNNIYSNNTEKRSNYGVNLNHLPAGTKFGMMRKSSTGDIHFYINGVDQGSAISGISGPIYGIAELDGNAEKITILKP